MRIDFAFIHIYNKYLDTVLRLYFFPQLPVNIHTFLYVTVYTYFMPSRETVNLLSLGIGRVSKGFFPYLGTTDLLFPKEPWNN